MPSMFIKNQKTISLINGQLTHSIDINNRLVQFGDGVFETCQVKQGNLLFWQQHFKRLKQGATVLNIPVAQEQVWLEDINKIINASQLDDAVIKLVLSRGESQRGYAFVKTSQNFATRILNISPLPKVKKAALVLMLCQSTYGNNPRLSGIKHCNRLDNILASQELTQAMDDGIMLNQNQQIISSTKANVFMVKKKVLITPEITQAGILGTRREIILNLAYSNKIAIEIRPVIYQEILEADEVFLTNSIFGIAWVKQIEQTHYVHGKITQTLSQYFLNL